mmetsp:Transcript_10154/g.22875  ORF Transcript_10154/g.22875 Transcript_10154/m.22875 type:complete len:221 (-) Transcript_10154:75-737(-)
MQGLDASTVKKNAKAAQGPIFLENPDGTITEAIPSNFRQQAQKIRHERRHSDMNDSDSSGSVSDSTTNTMYQEVDFLYSRHERVLILLLCTQFCLEVLYDVVYVVRMEQSVMEFLAMYSWRLQPRSAELFFWIIFVFQVFYGIAYYAIAGVAIWTKRPKNYRLFANWSLVGIVVLVLLAYVDKFNLLIFFLRLLAYIYARFLQGLTASLLLLPPSTAQQA